MDTFTMGERCYSSLKQETEEGIGLEVKRQDELQKSWI
jgi:hypothetical protein